MSLRPTFATLYGFDTHHEIPALHRLSILLHEHPPDDLALETLAEQLMPRRGITGASWVKHPLTSDRYRWFGALEGTTAAGKIALLIPYCSDQECRDGVGLDRMTALYSAGDVPRQAVNAFVRQVFMRYQNIMSQESLESAGCGWGGSGSSPL